MSDEHYNGGLIFRRKTDAFAGTQQGLVYLHTWNDGYQELIFATHAQAEDWAKARNLKHQLVVL